MYEAYYSPLTGEFAARIVETGGIIPRNGAEWGTFLAWNAAQPVPLDVSDHAPPTPPTLRERAIAAFNDAQAEAALRDRAIVLALVDQLNVIGQKHNALLTWLSGQAGLTNKAALAGFALPDNIQPTQAKATIEAKIETGGAD